jgi:hypothetical protein
MFPARNGLIPRNQIMEMDENYLYYFGEQSNSRNYWVSQDNAALKFLESQNNQIFTLTNGLHGKMVEFMAKYHITTELLSSDARTIKKEMRNRLMFAVDHKEFLEGMAMLGFYYNPIPQGEIIKTKEDVDAYMNTTYQEFGALVAEDMANLQIKISDYVTLKADQFLDVIIAGMTGTKRTIRNGLVFEEKYRPQELILDLRQNNDNNYNDAAWFRGGFKTMTIDEMLEYGSDEFTPSQVEEIKACGHSTLTGSGASYIATTSQQTTGYFNYWGKGTSSLEPITTMSVVDMYWFSSYDNRMYNTPKGVKEFRDYRDNGEPIKENQIREGDYKQYRLRQGKLWGGKWLTSAGLVPNAEYHPITKKQQFPISVYIDNYTGGYYKSRVSRMKALQDDINLADQKIKEAEIGDLGVNHIIKDTGADSKVNVRQILKSFKTTKMWMARRDPDQDPDEFIRQKFSEVVDFTGALNVVQIYQSIKSVCISEMGKMMNLPDASLGLQSSTIGKGVQENTVQLAETGVTPLFNGFINFIQRDLMFDVNYQKIVWLASPRNEEIAKNFIGDRGLEWLKTAVHESNEYLGIYINPYDTIDAVARQKLDAKLAFYASQGNGLTPLEDLQLSDITSLRKAIIYLREVYKRKEKKQEEMMAQQRMDNLQITQANNEAMLQGKSLAPQALKETTAMKTEASKEIAAGNDATKDRNNQREAEVKLVTHQPKA